jgi:hypothetical protein
MRECVYRIVGVTFKNEDGTPRQDILKDIYDDYWLEDEDDQVSISLVREPNNQYDSNAIAVFASFEGTKGRIGYIGRGENEELVELFKIGCIDGSGSIESMGLARGAKVACDIKISIYEEDDMIHDNTGRAYYF